jgi:hypothetical protein
MAIGNKVLIDSGFLDPVNTIYSCYYKKFPFSKCVKLQIAK